jgi:hypothetical protein
VAVNQAYGNSALGAWSPGRRANGEFEPLTPGSAKPVEQTLRHVGIGKVKRYGFSMA